MSGLEITPQVTITAQLRRASSSCCGAKLDPGPAPPAVTCRACGRPCQRVLGEPEEVTFGG